MGIFSYLNPAQASSPEGKAASHLQSLIVFLVVPLTVPSVGASFQLGTSTAQLPCPKFGVTWWGALAPWPSHCTPLTPTTGKSSPFPPSIHSWAQGRNSTLSQTLRFDSWDFNLLLKSYPHPLQDGLCWECCALLWDINPFPAAFSLDETLGSDERTQT